MKSSKKQTKNLVAVFGIYNLLYQPSFLEFPN